MFDWFEELCGMVISRFWVALQPLPRRHRHNPAGAAGRGKPEDQLPHARSNWARSPVVSEHQNQTDDGWFCVAKPRQIGHSHDRSYPKYRRNPQPVVMGIFDPKLPSRVFVDSLRHAP